MPTPTLPNPSFQLNPTSAGLQRSTAVAALEDGRFAAVYADMATSLGTLRYVIFNADGTLAHAATMANAVDLGIIGDGEFAIAALTGGGFAITWSSNSSTGIDIHHRVFDAAGAAITGDILTNAGLTLGSQHHPDIVADGAGGFTIVWDDDSYDADPGPGVAFTPTVRALQFGSNGLPIGGITQVGDAWGGDSHPAVATSRDHSRLNVVFDDDLGQSMATNGNDSIRGVEAGGLGAYRVDSGPFQAFHGDPNVAYSTGTNFMAVWSEFLGFSGGVNLGYAVYGAVNGGVEFKVNTTPHTHDSTMPKVVGLQSGNFLVVWDDGGFGGSHDALGQLFSVTGTPIGSEFMISDHISSYLARVEASEMLDGRIVVTFDTLTVGINETFARMVDPRDTASNWVGTGLSEQYVGTSFNDNLDGAGGNDRLSGALGNDTLSGGLGNDRLDGGDGNDAISGLDGIDVLIGGAGNDMLTGGLLADVLDGGAGNDVYVMENGTDTIVDAAGVDTVWSTITRSIAGYAAIERLTLLNVATALNGTGNNLANIIVGNNFANALVGGIGNDNLAGGAGNDTLIGGVGIDTLTGGANNDVFVFNSAPNTATNRDIVTDYVRGLDHIYLENLVFTKLGALAGVHALNPAYFRAGTTALDANDYLVYNRTTGTLYYDANANAVGGAIAVAVLTNHPVLTSADFVVI